MNRNYRIIVIMVILLCSCTFRIPVIRYSPSIIFQGNESVSIGDFVYKPYEEGKLESDQIYSYGIGDPSKMVAYDNIASIVKDALIKEMKFSGYKIEDGSNKIIRGDIIEFSWNALGFKTEDYIVVVKFYVLNNQQDNLKVIYSCVCTGKCIVEKVRIGQSLITSSFHVAIGNAINQFLINARGAGAL